MRDFLQDTFYSFLLNNNDRDSNIILAIDEPEASLHISKCYSQFEKLIGLSKFNHQILVHSNNSVDETSNYLKSQSIYEMKSDQNYGLCTTLNNLVKKAEND